MDMTSVYAEIVKSTAQDDGSLLVYGKATGSDLDLDQQRCDPEWLKTAMPEWFRGPYGGNVREQHDSHRAVGKATEHEVKDDGHWITAKVIDPIAKAKVEAGVLSGFSIGISSPRIEKSPDAANGVISGGKIIEVSLVDRPCLPTAMFTMCKAAHAGWEGSPADLDEELGLVKCEELVEKAAEDAEVEKAAPAATGCGCCDKCVTPGDSCCDMCQAAEKAAEPEVEKTYSREEALELVKSILGKADAAKEDLGVTVPPVDLPEEHADIMGAKAAIAIIAELIKSEADDMVCAPNEDYDIECLMQAVQALRVFIMREKGELGGDPSLMYLSADADVEKADKEPYGDVEYADPGLQKDGKKRYPIDTEEHCRAAWSYINKDSNAAAYSSADLAKVKARIKAACKKFGIDISDKAIEPEVTKTTEEAPVADIVETVEEAQKIADEALEKSQGAAETVELTVEKAATVEVDTEVVEKAVAEALAKAFSAEVLEKEDNPLRKTFTAIVEAATESIAKATADAVARLEKVEQMAVPGGPALRRTEVERAQSRKNDLTAEVVRFKSLANATEDVVLRKGYAQKAAALEAEIKAL